MTLSLILPRLTQVPALVLAGLLLSGCALVGENQSDKPAEGSATENRLPPLTTRDHSRILAAFGGEYESRELEALGAEILEKLAPVSELPAQRYRLSILNSSGINAFALPSGHIYITRGMLALINDTAEFAAVLGHEMAHISANHAAMREEQVKTDEIVARFRSRLLNDQTGAQQRLSSGRITLAGFSRAQELQADAIGVNTVAKAGFDAFGASRFLTNLERYMAAYGAPKSNQPDFLATHPSNPERIQQALMSARTFTGPDQGIRDRERYLKAIDGLAYGDDPRRGLVRGRSYIHARLGFTMLAPEGFALDNGAQAVTGIGPNDTALRLDLVKIPASQSLSDYLASGWADGLITGTIEPSTINGFQIASALAKSGEWTFRIYVIRFGTEVYRVIFGAQNLTPEIDASFRASMDSFRRLTSNEIRDIRQPRIRIIRNSAGDSVQTLSDRRGGGPELARQLRILNGLDLQEDRFPGDSIKVVEE